ncbi:MAG: hypothetical protein WCJ94_02490 [bacterium]
MKKIILIISLALISSTFVLAEDAKAIPVTATVSVVATLIPATQKVIPENPIGVTGTTTTANILTPTAIALTTTVAVKVSTTVTAVAVTSTAVVDLSPANITFDVNPKDGIKLSWIPKQKENVYYNVYRTQTSAFSKINKDQLSKAEYIDSAILTSTVYFYKVEAMDTSFNAYMSISKSVKSADMTLPQPPVIKAFQDIQSISLKWAQATQGTLLISGYNFYRGRTPEEHTFIKFVPYTKTFYADDDVVPGLRYYYTAETIDISGNVSKQTDSVTAVPFPMPRTSICLLPTAYRNNIFDNMGLNVDMGFTYFIGTIFGEHTDILGDKKTDSFQKIGVWLLSLDAKWTFINEGTSWYPSLGLGVMYSMLLQDSIGGSTQSSATGGGTTIGTKDKVLGQQGIYVTAAKNVIWDTTMYGGYVQGFKISKQDKGKGAAGYLTYIVSSILGDFDPAITGSQTSNTSAEVRNAFYFGLSRELFKKVGVKIELTVPLQFNKNPFLPNTYIINTHIDRLFNFDISYLHYDGGYAWVGYYNLRFSIYPSPYK